MPESPADEEQRDHPLSRLLEYARSYRSWMVWSSLFSILNKVFDLAPPVLIGVAVDIVVADQKSLIARAGVEDSLDQLIILLFATLFIWALESLFEYLQKKNWRNIAQTLQHDMRLDAYRNLQNQKMSYFHEKGTGSLMAILNDDINQLERFLNVGADRLLQVTTTAVVIVTAFFWLAPGVAWMAMFPIPFIIWGSFKYQRLLEPRYDDVREEVGNLNQQLENNLSGIATIKSFATEDYEELRIRNLSNQYREANRKAIWLSSAFSPMIRMAIVVGFSATLVYGGMLTIEGELGVGAYSVLVFLTQRLLWPLTDLGETFDLYQRGMASTRRILNLINLPTNIEEDGRSLLPGDVEGAISFQDVHFSYPGREPLLENFRMHIPAGSTLGLVGPTGAGKSTLGKLLLRLFEPQKGCIRIDGQNISDLALPDLRKLIGFVPQDPFLFRGTIRENIQYGHFDADEQEVRQAAEMVEVDAFVDDLPDGYDTPVGERGETLSGGQKQRISLARAILGNPPILLLDEATSAVDNETEAAIQRSLARLATDRTMVVIAHRLSTVRNADEIVVLEQGERVEQGTHEELVEAGNRYETLWNIQTGRHTIRDGERRA